MYRPIHHIRGELGWSVSDTQNLPDYQVTVRVQAWVQSPELRLRESAVCPYLVAVVTWDDRIRFGTRRPCRC